MLLSATSTNLLSYCERVNVFGERCSVYSALQGGWDITHWGCTSAYSEYLSGTTTIVERGRSTSPLYGAVLVQAAVQRIRLEQRVVIIAARY